MTETIKDEWNTYNVSICKLSTKGKWYNKK